MRVLSALADSARLAVVDALVLGDSSPGELRAALDLSSNLLAHHLGILEREGIVTRHRSQGDRRRSYLRLVPDSLVDVLPGHQMKAVQAPATAPVARVVFACTAASARSQLAAALWARASTLPAIAGGTLPAAAIAPGAIATAKRHQLPLPQAKPRRLPELSSSDVLVTVCDNAYEAMTHDDAADLLGTPAYRLHWSVRDPVPIGTKRAFDTAYADLEGRVTSLAHYLDRRVGA